MHRLAYRILASAVKFCTGAHFPDSEKQLSSSRCDWERRRDWGYCGRVRGGDGVISKWRSRRSWSLIDSCAKLGLCEVVPVCRGLVLFPSLVVVAAAVGCCCSAFPESLRTIASCSWVPREGLGRWRRRRRGMV